MTAEAEPFAGERLTSAPGGQTQIEHDHRYGRASTRYRDVEVRDVVGGEGYRAVQIARSGIRIEWAERRLRSSVMAGTADGHDG